MCEIVGRFQKSEPSTWSEFLAQTFRISVVTDLHILCVIIVIVKIHIKQLGWKLQFHCIAKVSVNTLITVQLISKYSGHYGYKGSEHINLC